MKRNVSRTYSRGLGHDFARADAERVARFGLPVNDMFFQLKGFNMKRKPESVYKFQQRLAAAGVADWAAQRVTDSRILFSYLGSMRDEFFNTWYDARTRIKGRRPDEKELGEALVQSLMKRESDEFSEFLRSPLVSIVRELESTFASEMGVFPERLTPVHIYETVEGVLQDGSLVDGRKLPVVFRKPKDRLAERRLEIDRLRRLFEKAKAVPDKLVRLKRHVSTVGLDRLETETLFANRPEHVRERFKRDHDVERFDRLADKLADALDLAEAEGREADFARYQERADWLLDFGMVSERDAFGLPRFTVHHECVGEKVLWHWLNGADDFGFRDLRERLVAKHFDAVPIAEGSRVLTAKTGPERWFLQREVFSDKAAWFDLGNPSSVQGLPAFKAVSGFKRWASRELSSDQVAAALRNEISLRSVADRDPLFYGPEPLKPRGM